MALNALAIKYTTHTHPDTHTHTHTHTCQIIQRRVCPDQIVEWYCVSYLYPVTVAVEILCEKEMLIVISVNVKVRRCPCVCGRPKEGAERGSVHLFTWQNILWKE